MTKPDRILLPLLDFGWCDYDRIALFRSVITEDVIREYVKSEAFGNPFVHFSEMSDEYARQCHGPFLRAKIHEADFELISRQVFKEEIKAIRYLSDFAEVVPDEKWEPLEKLVERIYNRNSWFFSLRLTEKNKSHFHESGFVLDFFREFICASPNSEFIERLIFGRD